MPSGLDIANQRIKSIGGLRKNDKPRFVIAMRIVYVFIKEVCRQMLFEGIHLRVIFIFIPPLTKLVYQLHILLQVKKVGIIEISTGEFAIVFSFFGNQGIQPWYGILKPSCFLYLLVHINVRADVYHIILQHIYHILSVLLQVMKRCLECGKTALESFNQKNSHNIGELL